MGSPAGYGDSPVNGPRLALDTNLAQVSDMCGARSEASEPDPVAFPALVWSGQCSGLVRCQILGW